LSKIEAGRMELRETDFDLVALLENLSSMFRVRCEQKGLMFRVEVLASEILEGAASSAHTNPQPLDDSGPRRSAALHAMLVYGDEGKLRQVLINLLGNAVKFTERGEVVLKLGQASRLPVSKDSAQSPEERRAACCNFCF